MWIVLTAQVAIAPRVPDTAAEEPKEGQLLDLLCGKRATLGWAESAGSHPMSGLQHFGCCTVTTISGTVLRFASMDALIAFLRSSKN